MSYTALYLALHRSVCMPHACLLACKCLLCEDWSEPNPSLHKSFRLLIHYGLPVISPQSLLLTYCLAWFSHLLFCASLPPLRSERTDVESTHSSSNCSAQNAANANKAAYGHAGQHHQGQQQQGQHHQGQQGQQQQGQHAQEVPLTRTIPPDALYGVVEKRAAAAVIQAPPNHFLQVRRR